MLECGYNSGRKGESPSAAELKQKSSYQVMRNVVSLFGK